ncbi:MAG: hypothetical protein R2856_29040 [Caldilineaceae bacterium]
MLSNLSPPRDAATRWIAHAIDRQPVSLVGRPKPGRDGLSLGELIAGESLVMPTAQSSIRTGFAALVDRLGIRPRIVAEVDDMAMLRLVAREHAGRWCRRLWSKTNLTAACWLKWPNYPD